MFQIPGLTSQATSAVGNYLQIGSLRSHLLPENRITSGCSARRSESRTDPQQRSRPSHLPSCQSLQQRETRPVHRKNILGYICNKANIHLKFQLLLRPKSPPNSPNPELSIFPEELKGVYINRLNTCGETSSNPNQTVTASELIWDWTSRPNVPPK